MKTVDPVLTIVCDGTMIGMQKDLMLPIKNCDLDEKL